MNNPIDEFLDKYGGNAMAPLQHGGAFKWGELGQHAGNALVGAAAVGAGTAALGGLGIAADRIYNAVTAKRDFRGMMEWNQDLAHEDQRMVNQSFRTLRQFAPDMSKDPLVAGAMIRQMVQAPQGAAGIVNQALMAQRNIGSDVGRTALTAAGKSMGEGMKGFQPFCSTEVERLKEEHADAFSREQGVHKQREEEFKRHMQGRDQDLAGQDAHHQQQEQQGRYNAYWAGRKEKARAENSPAGTQIHLPGFGNKGQGPRRRKP